jgi:hypothetical protein
MDKRTFSKTLKLFEKKFDKTFKYRNDFLPDNYYKKLHCWDCCKEKPLRLFPYRKNYSLNKEKRCKSCNNFNNQYRRSKLNVKQTLQNCLTSSKSSSKKRLKRGRIESGINTLTIEELLKLYEKQKGKCSISGVKMSLLNNSNYIVSIDRIDSNKGYTINNIQLVTKIVNQAKNNLKLNIFYKMIQDIYNNNNININDNNDNSEHSLIVNKLKLENKFLLQENNRLKQKILKYKSN